jgi:hypothetical protein
MIVLVSGGRDFDNEEAVYAGLDTILDKLKTRFSCLVHGACGLDAEGPIADHFDPRWSPGRMKGADKHTHSWALNRGVEWMAFPANWTKYGDSAGPRRNKEMVLTGPGLAVFFPGGKGTLDCLATAKRMKVPCAFVRIVPRFMVEWPASFQTSLF